jgi:hypothetical protein
VKSADLALECGQPGIDNSIPLATFSLGIRRLIMADKWKGDTLGIYGAYDFGWVMRPHPKNPSQDDLVGGFV